MSIKLEIGKAYVDGWNVRHVIAGPTRDYPEKWVYTHGGDWFNKDTGAAVAYDRHRGHYELPLGSYRSIQRELRSEFDSRTKFV